tara:strand:+ start:2255 stop:2911 length:657 start_codon:yes stop_codon:yes gene_type:complete
MINVYTDGSCINNGKENAKAGIGIFFGINDSRNVAEEILINPTNNVAEMTAILKVFDILKEEIEMEYDIYIYTDSKYSINSFTIWSKSWEKNNWKKKDNKKIKNLELIKKGYELFNKYNNVELIHIKAHTNKHDEHSIGNENADTLANIAIGNTKEKKIAKEIAKKIDKDIAKNYIFTFGKYKNKDINYVKENNMNYLHWCIKNLKNKNIVNIIKKNL